MKQVIDDYSILNLTIYFNCKIQFIITLINLCIFIILNINPHKESEIYITQIITMEAQEDTLKKNEMAEEQDQSKIKLTSQEQQIQRQQLKHQRQVKTAFANYSKDMKQTYSRIFSAQKLPHYFQLVRQRKRQLLEKAIGKNQQFLDTILQFLNHEQFDKDNEKKKNDFVPFQSTSCSNVSKIRTTIKQFYRQWCANENPQAQDYFMLVDKAKKYIGDPSDKRIIVPGCGLGRLVLQIVQAGFACQGNQVTYFMLFGSNFILNASQQKQQFEIYPFIHSFTDIQKQEDMFRSVRIPDKVASDVVTEDADFSMATGQFTQVYDQQIQKIDGVITCFFVDTANNIFAYIDTIYKILKPGGIWINYGPLLFHYKDMLDQVSIQISYEQLQMYIADKGFILLQKQKKSSTYCHNPKSTLTNQYNCLLTVWRK